MTDKGFPMTREDQVANFLAMQHEDCSLNCLPEFAPPLSGRATQSSYRFEAVKLLEMLGLDPNHKTNSPND